MSKFNYNPEIAFSIYFLNVLPRSSGPAFILIMDLGSSKCANEILNVTTRTHLEYIKKFITRLPITMNPETRAVN